mmetsp:Transcript_61334/g.168434  ORF Transcript_61334/g.168434 Transcript_61334/m.168434 type:complete len:301 (-) Transcript_61334:144-1046(-)
MHAELHVGLHAWLRVGGVLRHRGHLSWGQRLGRRWLRQWQRRWHQELRWRLLRLRRRLLRLRWLHDGMQLRRLTGLHALRSTLRHGRRAVRYLNFLQYRRELLVVQIVQVELPPSHIRPKLRGSLCERAAPEAQACVPPANLHILPPPILLRVKSAPLLCCGWRRVHCCRSELAHKAVAPLEEIGVVAAGVATWQCETAIGDRHVFEGSRLRRDREQDVSLSDGSSLLDLNHFTHSCDAPLAVIAARVAIDPNHLVGPHLQAVADTTDLFVPMVRCRTRRTCGVHHVRHVWLVRQHGDRG